MDEIIFHFITPNKILYDDPSQKLHMVLVIQLIQSSN